MAKRNTDGFNPYHLWLGIPETKCPPTFYELLGVSLNEDERAVIKSAADRQRSHVEQFLGTDLNKYANKLISQIDEAEITLLSPELRREYDRKVKLFKKRRKERQIDPNFTPSSISSDGSRSVGEGSGFLREYAGIVAILAVAFFCMAAASFWLPWGKVKTEKVVENDQPAQGEKPAPEPENPVLKKENPQPEPEMPAQEKPKPQPIEIDNSNLATIDVTILAHDIPNHTLLVSRKSKKHLFEVSPEVVYLHNGQSSSLNFFQAQKPDINATIAFDAEKDLVLKIETED